MSHQIRCASSGVEPKCTSSMNARSAWVTTRRTRESLRIERAHRGGGQLRRGVVRMPLAAVLEPHGEHERHARGPAGRSQRAHRRPGRRDAVERGIRADRGCASRDRGAQHILPPGDLGLNGGHRPQSAVPRCRCRAARRSLRADSARTRRAGGSPMPRPHRCGPWPRGGPAGKCRELGGRGTRRERR